MFETCTRGACVALKRHIQESSHEVFQKVFQKFGGNLLILLFSIHTKNTFFENFSILERFLEHFLERANSKQNTLKLHSLESLT